jgi:hypothetical protein
MPRLGGVLPPGEWRGHHCPLGLQGGGLCPEVNLAAPRDPMASEEDGSHTAGDSPTYLFALLGFGAAQAISLPNSESPFVQIPGICVIWVNLEN